MNHSKSISIIGRGAVGMVMFDFFVKNNYPIRSVWDRSSGFIFDSDDGSKKKMSTQSSFPNDEKDLGDFVFLAVPDDQIKIVTKRLSEISIDWNSRSVIHFSGNLVAEECSLLKDHGAAIASMHPIQTFTSGDRCERLKGITISLQGQSSLCLELSEMVIEMGANPMQISAEQKGILHIAAVFSSNYIVSLLNISDNLLSQSGLKSGIEILEPLLKQTVQNITSKGITEALTGPVSRGDYKSVQKHINHLQKNRNILDLYKKLGSEALKIAKKKGDLSDLQINRLEDILNG
ncbi:MAG: DUF2520 domain-containing protein [Balneolaceae bacterium]